ncbi:unnamed protein product [Rhizoctonia solani]|uniref:Uncharacterized protein n=1 Tax=Rhizoctonia solani TaxID=456999 RepID=A0A8H2XTI4_9AGAM|nr:unnamed protein product [Rhizoctonia solani]
MRFHNQTHHVLRPQSPNAQIVSQMSTSPPHLISRIKPLRIATLHHPVRPPVGSAPPRRAPKPTVVATLAAKGGPMNLRIEEFRDAKSDWSGVKSETRDALKRVLKER